VIVGEADLIRVLHYQLFCYGILLFIILLWEQVAYENKPILGKHERLLKFFLEFKKGMSPMKIDQNF